MAYIRVWTSTTPVGSSLPAKQLDDSAREKLVDIEERMATVIGTDNWKNGVDPVIDGSSVKSLLALTSEVATKPTINASTGVLPKRASASSFTDSGVTDDGGTVTFVAGRKLAINTVSYTWPTSGTNGYFLKFTTGGTLVWDSVAAAGAITGSGTQYKIPYFSGAANLSDSTMTLSSGAPFTITVNGNLVVTDDITQIMKFKAADSSSASIRLPHGSDPSSPTDGDFWTTTTSVKARLSGATKSLVFGAGTSGNIPKYTSSSGELANSSISEAGSVVTIANDLRVDSGPTLSWSAPTLSVHPGGTAQLVLNLVDDGSNASAYQLDGMNVASKIFGFPDTMQFGSDSHNILLCTSGVAVATSTTKHPAMPYCAGVPTGVPYTLGAYILDDTNLRLYVRTGIGWKYAALV